MEPYDERDAHHFSHDAKAPASLLTGLEKRLDSLRQSSAALPTAQDLGEALCDKRWEIRAAAVQATTAVAEQAEQAEQDTILPLLQQALHDDHYLVRMMAVRALGHSGDHGSLAHLLSAVQDHDWQVREMAALTLGEIDDPSLEGALSSMLDDSNSNVRDAAALALRTLHKEGTHKPMAIIHQPPQTPERVPFSGTVQTQGTRPCRTLGKGMKVSLLGALVAVLLLTLTGAGLALGWWNPLFGNPDLYQTVGQSRSDHGVTITVTKVYADEGRTIIVYELVAKDTIKQYYPDAYSLSGSTQQKQEPTQGTECSGWKQGVVYCYMLMPAFEVPKGVNRFTLTWDVPELLAFEPTVSKSSIVKGSWHFSFTVLFHHVNNQQLPDPIHGGMYINNIPQP
jgi:hypothetical protein